MRASRCASGSFSRPSNVGTFEISLKDLDTAHIARLVEAEMMNALRTGTRMRKDMTFPVNYLPNLGVVRATS